MKIQFLGTGAAEGVPAMFCACHVCKKIRSMGKQEVRTRSQVVIDGKISVDFPPEAYYHSFEHGVDFSALKFLLITHSHMDHFYAHDFILHGYKYAKLTEQKLKIFGNAEVEKVFKECTAREMRSEVAASIEFKKIRPFCVFEECGYKIISIPSNHRTKEDSLLYYVEKDGKGYLHFYDTYKVDIEVLKFLKANGAKANVVAFDCTFADNPSNENSRHMNIYDDMQMKDALRDLQIIDEKTKIIITHFSHNSNPTRERLAALSQKFGVITAYDGMEVEV